VLAFALSTYKRWSNAAADEFDIDVDLNGDGNPDYAVVEADYGLVTAGAVDGRPAVFVFDLRTGDGTVDFLADAPTDSTTMVLPVLFDQLCNAGSPCLSASNPRFTYFAAGFGADGSVDHPESTGVFNAFTPAVSTGMFNTVAPNSTVAQQVTIDPTEFATAPGRGVMVVSHDNRSETEATLISY
jgi:minor extracellular serine protease Vpr